MRPELDQHEHILFTGHFPVAEMSLIYIDIWGLIQALVDMF